jgi:cold shock protein
VATGVVKWFDPRRRYGFITEDGGPEVFVHANEVLATGASALREGQRVEFDVTQTAKGPQATSVRPIG